MKTQDLKSHNNRITLAGIATVFFILTALMASADDFTKTYKEKYPVQKGATLNVINKFGDIHCQVWEESSVSILVTITVDASSQEKANKVFEKISVALSGSSSLVSGKTEVGNINNGDFSIDYDIMMPKWINIDLDNSFGEIYLGEVDGSTKINLEYGAMKADAINGMASELTIKFSESTVEYFKDGEVSVEYGGFESEGAGSIDLYSRFSHVDVEKLEKLNLDSQYDEIEIGSTGQVIAIGRFSELNFDKIATSFEFDSEYGDVNVDYIGAGFTGGKVRNSFAGANLTFDPKASFSVDAELEFGDMDYPSGNTSLSKQTLGYNTNIYKGKIGSASTTSGQLTVRSKHADVNIEFAE